MVPFLQVLGLELGLPLFMLCFVSLLPLFRRVVLRNLAANTRRQRHFEFSRRWFSLLCSFVFDATLLERIRPSWSCHRGLGVESETLRVWRAAVFLKWLAAASLLWLWLEFKTTRLIFFEIEL